MIKTFLKKGIRGWECKSQNVQANGVSYEITTMKMHNKKIRCVAQAGVYEDKGDYKIFKFLIFSDARMYLSESKSTRATEKNIEETHNEGLRKFRETFNLNENFFKI